MNGKDREELTVLKTDMQYVKKHIDHVNDKLTKFIESADKMYARKDELREIRQEFIDHRKDHNDLRKGNREWIIQIIGWAIVISIALAARLGFGKSI